MATAAAPGSIPILAPGRNCWRVEHAARLAFLVDGADFFRAFREAAKAARRSLLIVGWDIDSRVELLREAAAPGERRTHAEDGLPVALGDFLHALLRRNRDLRIHVLDWDFTMLFAPAREWMPLYKEKWTAHPRLFFHLDDHHPVGACHHQKIIVIDDRVAFAGGLDLTRGRWDTSRHDPGDPLRRDLASEAVPPPYHDVQAMVEGRVAAALGELARRRWQQATGEALEAPVSGGAASSIPVWPAGLPPALEDIPVAIARTLPRYRGQDEAREVECLLLDAIAAARHVIYTEAQYLTSTRVGAALRQRLEEGDGPEIVILLPEHTDGWLSQNTMDVLRERLLRMLRSADRHHRLRVYCPCIPGLGDQCVNVHSKILFVDDELLRVGSANLNNRSMGLDSECDLAVESGDDPRIREAIRAFRSRLLAEHLGVDASEVEARLAATGSLIRAIEALRGGRRTLLPLEIPTGAAEDAWTPGSEIVDPDRPLETDGWIGELVPEERPAHASHRHWLVPGMLAVVAVLAAAWQWSPLREWADVDRLAAAAGELAQTPAAPAVAIGIFVAGGLVAFPLTVLVLACILVFGPWPGLPYALLGALASAALTYGAGHALGRDAVRKLAGKRLSELSRRIGRHGLVAVALVRVAPVAPFTLINMMAGASHIRFRDFILGSALGLLPGMLGISLFADRLAALIRTPGPAAFALLVPAVAAIAAGFWFFLQWERRHRDARLKIRND
jgi:phosphatidylserine/phosphatidylglycerophosphate/cardiolipin synthase-like enzyme/uncharacterized membrane protein YdjX (TVP38/TMEM64 family)